MDGLFFGDFGWPVVVDFLDEPTMQHYIEMNGDENTSEDHDDEIVEKQLHPVQLFRQPTRVQVQEVGEEDRNVGQHC